MIKQFDWVVPASLAEVDRICAEFARSWITRPIDPTERFAVELLLREALANAVVHGSAENPEKWVSCQIRVSSAEVNIEVQDEGPGFDWRSRSGQLKEQLHDSGRGLVIYTLYASSYSFNEQGNCVCIRRNLLGVDTHGGE